MPRVSKRRALRALAGAVSMPRLFSLGQRLGFRFLGEFGKHSKTRLKFSYKRAPSVSSAQGIVTLLKEEPQNSIAASQCCSSELGTGRPLRFRIGQWYQRRCQ